MKLGFPNYTSPNAVNILTADYKQTGDWPAYVYTAEFDGWLLVNDQQATGAGGYHNFVVTVNGLEVTCGIRQPSDTLQQGSLFPIRKGDVIKLFGSISAGTNDKTTLKLFPFV